jgi:hypothetical protein
METPAESTPKADTNRRKLRPEVERSLERVVVPALVNRYIKKLKEGKNPLTTGSAAGAEYMRGNEARVREILAKVKPLAVEYYRMTGKPLGVTGEVAEYVAAEILGLTLVPARTVGYESMTFAPAPLRRSGGMIRAPVALERNTSAAPAGRL